MRDVGRTWGRDGKPCAAGAGQSVHTHAGKRDDKISPAAAAQDRVCIHPRAGTSGGQRCEFLMPHHVAFVGGVHERVDAANLRVSQANKEGWGSCSQALLAGCTETTTMPLGHRPQTGAWLLGSGTCPQPQVL